MQNPRITFACESCFRPPTSPSPALFPKSRARFVAFSKLRAARPRINLRPFAVAELTGQPSGDSSRAVCIDQRFRSQTSPLAAACPPCSASPLPCTTHPRQCGSKRLPSRVVAFRRRRPRPCRHSELAACRVSSVPRLVQRTSIRRGHYTSTQSGRRMAAPVQDPRRRRVWPLGRGRDDRIRPQPSQPPRPRPLRPRRLRPRPQPLPLKGLSPNKGSRIRSRRLLQTHAFRSAGSPRSASCPSRSAGTR